MTRFQSISLLCSAGFLFAGCEQADRQSQAPPQQIASAASQPDVETIYEGEPPAARYDVSARFADIPLAGSEGPTDIFERCMATGDAGRGVTVGILDCLGTEIDRQDERLNATYGQLKASLNRQEWDELRALQRRWIVERDQGCSDAAEPEAGGTLASIIYSQCILDRTIARSSWLERYEVETR